MTDTTLLINGFSVIDNPHVNTNSSGGGKLMIHGGTSPFEDDDIVKVLVEDANENGEVTGASKIVGVVVYDNATDYFNDTPMYTYEPMNPGQYANVQSDVSGLGDTYLRFNANVLVSDDPGAPHLNQLLLAPGEDLANGLDHGPIKLDRVTYVDYDQDNTIDEGTTEEGDGYFATENNIFAAICVARGTLIETPDGPRRVECLAAGDLVNTLDDGPQVIRWIGSRRVPGRGALAPIRIRAGALGNLRDLRVSQNHRMLITGAWAQLLFGEDQVLVAAKHLVNDSTIRTEPCRAVEYYHFLFDAHQIVFAEACPTESLYPGQQALDAVSQAARDEIIALFPELALNDCTAPLSRYELTGYEASALRRAR
ncbi:Hint domain-containing protein [Actibacterium sp. D379-3]